jgi:SH3 domain protein
MIPDTLEYGFCLFSEDQYVMAKSKQNKLIARACRFFCLTLFLTVWLLSPSAQATTLYVSDTSLEANLRTGMTSTNRIIALVRPGTRLKLLGEKEGWAEVSLEDGRTGWILRRYLSERPPWIETAQKLSAENERLKSQLGEIGGEHRELVQAHAELNTQMESQEQSLQAVRREYEELKKSSSNYLNLKMAYENLQSEARQSKAKLDEVQEAYKKLKLSTSIQWFLSGAGVLLLGGLLGSSMARMRRRRSGDYYRL